MYPVCCVTFTFLYILVFRASKLLFLFPPSMFHSVGHVSVYLPGGCLHHEHGPSLDFVVECFCYLHGCPFIIFSSPIYCCIVAAQHNMVTRSGVQLKLAILGVILYMKMHPTLYWCYTVKSLVINNELVQTTCSTSQCSQSLLPHMLFWNNFHYFCFCLVLFSFFPVSPIPPVPGPPSDLVSN